MSSAPTQTSANSPIVVADMDLDRDWNGIEQLLRIEQWPFVREDFEVSHEQPLSVAMVARRADEVLGFFSSHHFGAIGYLDMMIIDLSIRQTMVARKFWRRTLASMKTNGIGGLVAHSTKDSAPVFQAQKFSPGVDFTLLRREAMPGAEPDADADLLILDESDRQDLVMLDASVFGLRRDSWIEALYAKPAVQFVGLRSKNQLLASICLRPRHDKGVCLDSCNASRFEDLERLIHQVLYALPHQPIECFARTGSDLYELLIASGFTVPDFFQSIGPLVEWRRGQTEAAGLGSQIRSLSWF
jgi:hypothetical protein